MYVVRVLIPILLVMVIIMAVVAGTLHIQMDRIVMVMGQRLVIKAPILQVLFAMLMQKERVQILLSVKEPIAQVNIAHRVVQNRTEPLGSLVRMLETAEKPANPALLI